jgi:hypothetical protein
MNSSSLWFHSTVPVIQVNGRPYVGLEALAKAVDGSLSSSGNMFALSFSGGSANNASYAASVVRHAECRL